MKIFVKYISRKVELENVYKILFVFFYNVWILEYSLDI